MKTRAPRRSPKNCLGQPLGFRLTVEELAAVDELASNDDRSRASFLRILLLRGLRVYESELASRSQEAHLS